MSTAVAVRSVGLIFIVGDETQVGPAPTASLDHVWDARGVPTPALTGAKLQKTDIRQDTHGQAQTHPRTLSSGKGEK